MAGFEVTLYGRIWVTPKAACIARSAELLSISSRPSPV
jgi:hypothetical protein